MGETKNRTDVLERMLIDAGYKVVTEHMGGNCTALRVTLAGMSGHVLVTERWGGTAPWAYFGSEQEAGALVAAYDHEDELVEELTWTEVDLDVPTVVFQALAAWRWSM